MARKVTYTFNPFKMTDRDKPTGEDRVNALKEIQDFVKVSILDFTVSANSSVSGHGRFKRLTKQYAKSKKRGNRTANLTLTGEMLLKLDTTLSGNKITVGIIGKQGDKAEGHNQLKSRSKLPVRRFIPDKKEVFKKAIVDGMKEIIDRHSEVDDGS